MRETLNYFDGINFAPRIRCPMLVYVGLGDDVCPPETGYALYERADLPEGAPRLRRAAPTTPARYWVMPKVEAFLAKHLKPAATGAVAPSRRSDEGGTA